MTDRDLIIAAARARGVTWPEGGPPRYSEIVRPDRRHDRQTLSNAYTGRERLPGPLRAHLAEIAGVKS